MITLLLSVQVVFGGFVWAPPEDTIAALQERGLSISVADFPVAINEAFVKRDKELVLAMAADMELSSDRANFFADQVMGLYEALPDDEFKQSIAVAVAAAVRKVDRVMKSRWACDFYGPALRVLCSPSGEKLWWEADVFFRELSKEYGLSLSPYLVKAVLVMPHDEIIFDEIILQDLVEGEWFSVTPTMAFHILRQYQGRACLTSEVGGIIRERAKPLLNAKQLPPGSSREDLLKQLDAMIYAEGKKLCDAYGDKAYVPLPPVAPRESEKLAR